MRRLDWLCAALLATIALAGLDSCFANEQADTQGFLRDDVQRIVKEDHESREQFQNERSKVKGRAEWDKIWQRKPGTVPQGNKIVSWAQQHPSDPLAVESLGMIILRNAGSQESATARTVLLTQHL